MERSCLSHVMQQTIRYIGVFRYDLCQIRSPLYKNLRICDLVCLLPTWRNASRKYKACSYLSIRYKNVKLIYNFLLGLGEKETYLDIMLTPIKKL